MGDTAPALHIKTAITGPTWSTVDRPDYHELHKIDDVSRMGTV